MDEYCATKPANGPRHGVQGPSGSKRASQNRGGQRRNSLLHSLNSVEFLDGDERRMPDRRWEENAECSSRVSPVGNHRVFTMFGSMLRMRKRCRYINGKAFRAIAKIYSAITPTAALEQ